MKHREEKDLLPPPPPPKKTEQNLNEIETVSHRISKGKESGGTENIFEK